MADQSSPFLLMILIVLMLLQTGVASSKDQEQDQEQEQEGVGQPPVDRLAIRASIPSPFLTVSRA